MFVFEEKCHRYCEEDGKGIGVSGILSLFQDTMTALNNHLGMSYDDLMALGYVWFATKYWLQVSRWPVPGEQIIVETELTAAEGFIAERTFYLSDDQGNLLIKGVSDWMLNSLSEQRVVRLEDVPEIKIYEVAGNHRTNFKRVNRASHWSYQREYQVQEADLDINRHVNHGKYVEWVENWLVEGNLNIQQFKDVKIVYKNQAYLGDVLTLKAAAQGAGYRFDILSKDGQPACQIEIQA